MEENNVNQLEDVEKKDVKVENNNSVETNVQDAPAKSSAKVKKSKEQRRQEKLAEYEGLSDDELYAKIQTDKLLKKKKNKRIATMVGMGFAFVLAVVIIVLAVVPVSLKPRFIESGFDTVNFYHGATRPSGGNCTVGDEKYEQFMKVYDKAFSQSYISAIFNGSLFSYEISESGKEPDDILGSNGELNENNEYYIILSFVDEQVLTNQNGSTYISTFKGKSWDGVLRFNQVYIVLSQTDGWQQTTVYVPAYYPDKNGEMNNTYLVTITLKANTNLIFDAWDELTK